MSDPAPVEAPMSEVNSPPKGGNTRDPMDAHASAAAAPTGGAGKQPVDDTAIEALLTLGTGSKSATGNGAPAPSGAGAGGIDVDMTDANGQDGAAKQPVSNDALGNVSAPAQGPPSDQQNAETEQQKGEVDLRPQEVRPFPFHPPPPPPPAR